MADPFPSSRSTASGPPRPPWPVQPIGRGTVCAEGRKRSKTSDRSHLARIDDHASTALVAPSRRRSSHTCTAQFRPRRQHSRVLELNLLIYQVVFRLGTLHFRIYLCREHHTGVVRSTPELPLSILSTLIANTELRARRTVTRTTSADWKEPNHCVSIRLPWSALPPRSSTAGGFSPGSRVKLLKHDTTRLLACGESGARALDSLSLAALSRNKCDAVRRAREKVGQPNGCAPQSPQL